MQNCKSSGVFMKIDNFIKIQDKNNYKKVNLV